MSALAFIESEQAARPQLANWYQQLADLYTRKLWHQLTLKLEEFVARPEMKEGDALIRLYQNFISDFELKLNLLKVAQLAVVVSRQYSEPESAYSFLESVADKLADTKEVGVQQPVLFVRIQLAPLKLAMGDLKECKRIIDESKATLDSLTDVDPSVHATVHWVSSQYYKAKPDFAEFFKSALLYLAYTDIDTLSDPAKLSLAVDLGLAALLGDNIYNFGELLAHPIVKSLEGSSSEWLLHVLRAYNAGQLAEYDKLCHTYANQLNAQPALVQNQQRLREKITILSLLELVFSRPAEDRTIALSTIAQQTKLSLEDVELLLMKALSVHLMEGVIDQVDGTVRVQWIQPRVLAIPQIQALRDRLDTWATKVHSTLLHVENEMPELLLA
eukprot:jgi/Chlat1/138/Chrsp1S00227